MHDGDRVDHHAEAGDVHLVCVRSFDGGEEGEERQEPRGVQKGRDSAHHEAAGAHASQVVELLRCGSRDGIACFVATQIGLVKRTGAGGDDWNRRSF